MIVLFPALVLIAAFIVWRSRRTVPDSAGGKGWRWFAGWSAAGAALTISFLTGFSIGLFILPLAAGLLIWVARSAPRPAEALGFIEGIGATLLLVAFLNRDYKPCSEHGRLHLPAGSPPGASVSCGGFDPVPWLIAGIVVSALPLLSYAFLHLRQKSVPHSRVEP